MSLPKFLSKTNLAINLLGFFASVVVMWFGVFILHLYDATGTKQTIGKLILGLDWLLIAVYGLTTLHITFSGRKTMQRTDLSAPIKVSSYLASTLVIFEIISLIVVIVFYIFLAVAFSHWSF